VPDLDLAPAADLLDLAHVRLAELLEPTSQLDALLVRLFNPDEDADRPVSAFSSAL
jgi:hypothetical protein